jgi:hypothetical protein
MEISAVLTQISALENKLKDAVDLDQKLEIKDQILEIKTKHNLIQSSDSPYTCEGCSA